VLLPDSETPRWEMDDRRYLEQALTATGAPFTVANAQGDGALQVAQAQEALVEGAQVLILAGVDSDTGAAVIAEARAAGARVIDYDRLTVSGPGADLHVSFDNFAVGSLMAQTLEPQINGLGVQTPNIVQLNGSPGDNNAALVRAGYSSVATPFYNEGRWRLAADASVDGWSGVTARDMFEQIVAEAGDEEIDAVFAANDVLAGAVVQVLKAQGRAPVLLSGQDATVEGLQNILAGWQTMTVYKPILQEASTAVVAALAFLNCETAASLNTTTTIQNGESDVPAILLDPVTVSKENIGATVIADGFRTWAELCVGEYEALCPPAEAR
jgi:D-xylose transport system substrate-binding protein